MKNINYWVENSPRPEGVGAQELPSKVDVAVVGSGYTGLNAAKELSKSGASFEESFLPLGSLWSWFPG